MRRTVYFAVEAVLAFIVSSIIWFICLKTIHFDFYHNSASTLDGIKLFSGFIVYVILTAGYIILGFRKVKGWRWWMSIFTILVSASMGFVGLFGAVYGSEFINSILH